MRVLLFGPARERCSAPSVDVSTSSLRVCDVVAALFVQFPALHSVQMGAFLVAVNQEYVSPSSEEELRPEDEVALIPPLSGG